MRKVGEKVGRRTDLIGAISGMTVRMTLRTIGETMRMSVRQVAVAAVLVGASSVCAGLLFGAISISGAVGSVPQDIRYGMLASALSGTSLISAVVAVIVNMAAPSRASFESWLAMLPVSRLAVNVGVRIPLLACSLIFSTALSGASFAVSASGAANWLEACAACVLTCVVISVSTLLAFAEVSLVYSLARRWLYMTHYFAVGLSGVVVMGLSVGLWAPPIFSSPSASRGSGWLFNDAAVTVAASSGRSVGGWLVLVSWIVATCALMYLEARMRDSEPVHRSLVVLTRTAPPHSPLAASVWAETVIMLRAPQTALLAVGLLLGLGGFSALVRLPLFEAVAGSLAAVLVLLPGFLGTYSVGRTRGFQWIGRAITANASWWVLPKVFSCTLCAALLAGPVAAAEVFMGLLPPDQMLNALVSLPIVLSAALLAGSIVPYTEDQPMSVVAASGLAGVLVWGSDFLVLRRVEALADGGAIRVLTALGVAFAFLLCFRQSSRLHPWSRP